jgi:16S rRNA (cytidine1402-2'-O)-methyltransferase
MNGGIQKGTLYLVSTPIGNLEDMTLRAVRVLSEVDLIAAEDTRTTKILLDRYHIRKPMVSYFGYNEDRRTPQLVAKLAGGSSVALVSEAGTPGISDPASTIVSAAIREHIPVVPVPGATAFLPALVASGFDTARFSFEGFLPAKKGRRTRLEELRRDPQTLIFYESPHRLMRTLGDLKEVLGDREIAVVRELTKKFEEIVRGKISQVTAHFSRTRVRGEFVLVVKGSHVKS